MNRIQRRRTPGWRMPSNAVYIGRPSAWGNPYRVVTLIRGSLLRYMVVSDEGSLTGPMRLYFTQRAHAQILAVNLYRAHINIRLRFEPDFLEPLRGKDLCCWCNEQHACHADVLLELLAEEVGHENAP